MHSLTKSSRMADCTETRQENRAEDVPPAEDATPPAHTEEDTDHVQGTPLKSEQEPDPAATVMEQVVAPKVSPGRRKNTGAAPTRKRSRATELAEECAALRARLVATEAQRDQAMEHLRVIRQEADAHERVIEQRYERLMRTAISAVVSAQRA